jgi:hypothetical protein
VDQKVINMKFLFEILLMMYFLTIINNTFQTLDYTFFIVGGITTRE